MTDRDHAQSVATLLSLEREEGLFDERFQGFSPWRVMRNMAFRANSPFKGTAAPGSNGRKLVRALAGTMRLLGILIACRRRDYLVKSCTSGLRLRSDAGWLDTYYDVWLQTGVDHFKLEEANGPDFEARRREAVLPAHLDPMVFTFWGKLLSELLPVSLGGFPDRVSTVLRERTGISIPPSRLRQRVSTTVWQARLYDLLLRRLKPRAVLVSDTADYGLMLAASRRGIPVVELQHGVFDDQHADAVPADAAGTGAELILPDVYASLGRFWLGQLTDTRQGRGRTELVGNSVIDLERGRRAAVPPRGALTVLVTSQGHETTALADWLDLVIAAAPAELDWRLQIKLHPIYDARDGGALSRFARHPHVTLVSGASDPSVYELLAGADLHLSISSLCHFDAAALGVGSVIIPLAGHEEILYAVDGDAICLAESPAAIWTALKKARAVQREGNYYCEGSFVANLQQLVETLARA